MNLLNIEYFLETSRTLNFTKAAKNLNISQQALSAHIAALERETDSELFERTSPLSLTEAGRLFKSYAEKFSNDYDSLMHELKDLKNDRRGTIFLSITHTRGKILLPKILPHFQQEFPQTEIRIYEANNEELQRAMLEGKLELLVCSIPVNSPSVATEYFYTEKTALLVSKELLEKYFGNEGEDVIKKIQGSSDLSPLRKMPFMLPHKGDIMRAVAEELTAKAGFTPKITVESVNTETLLEMAVRGMGITFYPRTYLEYEGGADLQKNLCIVPLNDQCAEYSIGFCWLRDRYLSFAAREFIRIAKENIRR